MDYLLITSVAAVLACAYGAAAMFRGRPAPLAYAVSAVLSGAIGITAAVTDRPTLLVLNLVAGAAAATLSIVVYRRAARG